MTKPAATGKVEPYSRLIVEYWPDTGTLSVATRKQLGEGFTVTPNLVIFYDPVDEDCPVGFILHSATTELKPFLDAVRRPERERDTESGNTNPTQLNQQRG